VRVCVCMHVCVCVREQVAKPLASMAWLFSLWLLNMEVARDLRECWVLKVVFMCVHVCSLWHCNVVLRWGYPVTSGTAGS